MENLSETDANILQAFGRGQGIVSGQAVRFPLLVQVKFDDDLVSEAIGDEDFIEEARNWQPDPRRVANGAAIQRNLRRTKDADTKTDVGTAKPSRRGTRAKPSRRGAIRPDY